MCSVPSYVVLVWLTANPLPFCSCMDNHPHKKQCTSSADGSVSRESILNRVPKDAWPLVTQHFETFYSMQGLLGMLNSNSKPVWEPRNLSLPRRGRPFSSRHKWLR